MYRSLLMLGAFLCSFAQISHAQCIANILPNAIQICEGTSATFNATAGGDIYQWYLNGTPVGTSSDELVLTGQPPGLHQVTVDITFGSCVANSSFSSLVVTANPQPAPTSNNAVCGGNLNLFVQTVPGATYAWMGPNSWASSMQNPVIMNVTPANAGVYTVNVTNSGCSGIGFVNVVIGSTNQVVASNNGVVCIGDMLQLSASTITGATYMWTGPNGFTSNQQNPSFIVNGNTDGGIYTVVANENGCTSTASTVVVICNTIYVNNYHDANANCQNENGIDNYIFLPVSTEIDSNGVIIDTITSTSGFYYTPNGTAGDVYTFKIISVPGDLQTSCPVTGIVNHTLIASGLTTIDMGLECNTLTGFDLSIWASNPISGAISQNGNIYVANAYCLPINATVTLTHSPKYQHSNSYPPPSSISGNTITWDFNALSNSGLNVVYYTLVNSNMPLVSGDTTHSLFTITPTSGDLNVNDNTFIKIDTVIASFDPNAITAYPQECVAPGTKMQYMIQFENLGNAPAEDIYVLDTLPAELEMNTMELVMSSHNMFVTKIQDGGYNIFRFDFPNIMLADSSNHAERHGMLVYTIDLNSALPYGAEIFHKAGIYFDYNAVVMTNNERSSICVPQNVSTVTTGGSTILYPNPAGDELTVQTDGSFSNATITNSIGQVMIEQQLDKKQQRINISSLAPGMYYVNISGAQGNEVVKFVKM